MGMSTRCVHRPRPARPPSRRPGSHCSALPPTGLDAWRSVIRTTRQLSITLPNDIADALRERALSGLRRNQPTTIQAAMSLAERGSAPPQLMFLLGRQGLESP